MWFSLPALCDPIQLADNLYVSLTEIILSLSTIPREWVRILDWRNLTWWIDRMPKIPTHIYLV